MPGKDWGDAYRVTTVCIDSYKQGEIAGRFYSPYREAGESFQSLSKLIVGMEGMLDEMNFPQSFTATRSFSGETEARPGAPPPAKPQRGQRATFRLRILFRQNTSWQGSIAWLEGKREQTFRSVLELILLMDSALEDAEASEAG